MKTKKRRDLKIMWMANSVNTNSGYAVFSRDLLYRMLGDGWNVSMTGNFGVEGYHTFIDGGDLIGDRFKGLKLKVYPKMNDPYGGDALVEHATDFGAHVAFAMTDLWTINTQNLQDLNNRNIKFVPYLPIDQDPPHQGILNNLNFAHRIATFSRYGQKTLQDHGYTSTLIPEGIDTEIFKPMNQSECRKEFQLPEDVFIFGMIGANKENPPRKGYQEAIEAFKKFSETHPEARMFFHTQQTHPGGFPIFEYGKYLGISDKFFFLNPYRGSFKSDSHVVAKELNCFDVLMHPSQTEGFGLLPVESQACGIPPIVNRCHSQPENVIDGVTGEICETGKPFFRNLNAYVYPADVTSLYNKMEILYTKLKDEKKKEKMKTEARKNVVENFNIETLYKEKWVGFLESLQDEILTKPE